jgi:segregation and condensation protein A
MALPKAAAGGLDALVDPEIDSTPDVVDSVALARRLGGPFLKIPPDR